MEDRRALFIEGLDGFFNVIGARQVEDTAQFVLDLGLNRFNEAWVHQALGGSQSTGCALGQTGGESMCLGGKFSVGPDPNRAPRVGGRRTKSPPSRRSR